MTRRGDAGRCLHRNVSGWMWRDDPMQCQPGYWSYAVVQPGYPSYHDKLTCLDCGHTLSLGPSNDEPPEVRREIQAAELSLPGATLRDHELLGWRGHNAGLSPFDSTEEAGYLARCIATHDNTRDPEQGQGEE